MDYNKMYCGTTKLDNLVRQKISEGWKMFAHEHPTENSKIDIISANEPSLSEGTEIKNATFQQKYLYKDGTNIGTCAGFRFWKYSEPKHELRKSTVNLPEYQWDYLEQAAIKLSAERKQKVSAAEYLRILISRDIIESSDPSK
jgi:hypothetical protein